MICSSLDTGAIIAGLCPERSFGMKLNIASERATARLYDFWWPVKIGNRQPADPHLNVRGVVKPLPKLERVAQSMN